MRNFKIIVCYDGTDYCGWQRQPNQPTVQEAIEDVLGLLEGAPVTIAGSGRTDSGVHALAQAASFQLSNPLPAENLVMAMNRLLPPAIRVLSAEVADDEFHARRSATAKTYEYRLWRRRICPPTLCRYVYEYAYALDEPAMSEAAERFVGRRDFCSLVASGGGRQTTVREIFSSVLERRGDVLLYRVRGNGFLYHMVRNIVGTLIEVGRGNLTPKDIDRVLEEKKRSAAGAMVPARGLFLVSVEYGDQ